MTKLLATVAVVAGLLAANTSANAGLFDTVNALKTKMHEIQQPRTDPRQPMPAPGSLSYLGNKPYVQCLNVMNSFAKNEAQRAQAARECTARYYR